MMPIHKTPVTKCRGLFVKNVLLYLCMNPDQVNCLATLLRATVFGKMDLETTGAVQTYEFWQPLRDMCARRQLDDLPGDSRV